VATHKSAIKRQKQAEKKHEINKSIKSALKTLAKKVEQAVEAKNTAEAKIALVKAMKAYDKAGAKGIVHKSAASRKISRLSTKVAKIPAA
jgi:small subunit ribosomal protein S20